MAVTSVGGKQLHIMDGNALWHTCKDNKPLFEWAYASGEPRKVSLQQVHGSSRTMLTLIGSLVVHRSGSIAMDLFDLISCSNSTGEELSLHVVDTCESWCDQFSCCQVEARDNSS